MINLKITTRYGTQILLSIPLDKLDAQNPAATPLSAVDTQPDTHVWVESPSPAQQSKVDEFINDRAIGAALEKFKAQLESEDVLGKFEQLEKEEKEEDGRIGGVGERKEDGDEEEKPCLETCSETEPKPLIIVRNGVYHISKHAMTAWSKAYGEQWLESQLQEMQKWISENIEEGPSVKMAGRFIKKWLSDKSGATKRKYIKRANLERDYARTEAQPVAHNAVGSLLNYGTQSETQDGW